MIRTELAKPTPQYLLSLNLRKVNDFFPGFTEGEFSLIKGSSSTAIASLLCVRAQLSKQIGGLSSNVVFIDGGNTFELYQISKLARIHHLEAKQVLDNIFISRAFTAYQMVDLIMDKLKLVIEKLNSKIAIISDLSGFFLDKDIQAYEATRLFSQVTTYLSNFAKERQIVLIATYLPHRNEKVNNDFQAIAATRSDVVLSLRTTKHDRVISLDKHPYLTVGSIELPSGNLRLTDFIGESA